MLLLNYYNLLEFYYFDFHLEVTINEDNIQSTGQEIS